MSDIETRLLRYFVAVAEERHFASAAERLGISPPTLTQQIQKLESQLGVKLLIRKGNTKTVVTDAGQQLLADARDILGRHEQATERARQAGRGELGRLQLGFLTLLSGPGLLRGWVDAFEQAHPAIEVATRKLTSVVQISGIVRKELDAGFVRTPHKYPPGVRGFEVYRQPLVLALPSKHPLARREAISPAMLAREAFVGATLELNAEFSKHIEAVARIGNFKPHVVKYEDDLITVLGHVGHSHGIAVVPELLKSVNVANVVFRNIAADPTPQASISFVYGSTPSPSAKLLIRHMQRHAVRKHGGGAAPPNGSARPKGVLRPAFSRAA